MSHFTATISAYDVMTDVLVFATVTDHDDVTQRERTPMTFRVLIPGTGEQEHARWLRDALLALAETL